MISRLLQSNHPSMALFLIPLTALVWIVPIMFPVHFSPYLQAAPFQKLLHMLTQITWISNTLFILIILFEALWLNIIVDKFKLTPTSNYMTAFIFILLSACFPVILWHLNILVANICLLAVINFSFEIYHNENPINNAFKCGMIISLASLFYWPALSFGLFTFAALIVLEKPSIRHLTVYLTGLILPFIYYLVYLFYFDRTDELISVLSGFYLNPFTLITRFDYSDITLISLLLIFMIPAFPSFYKHMVSNNISVRQMLSLLILFLLLSVLMIGYTQSGSLPLFFGIIPISIYLAIILSRLKKNFLAEVFILLMLLVILFHQAVCCDILNKSFSIFTR